MILTDGPLGRLSAASFSAAVDSVGPQHLSNLLAGAQKQIERQNSSFSRRGTNSSGGGAIGGAPLQVV